MRLQPLCSARTHRALDLLLLAASACALGSCSSGSDAPGTGGTPATVVHLSARAIDVHGVLLSGVRISSADGQLLAQTDAAGTAQFDAPNSGTIILRLDAAGHAEQIKRIEVPGAANAGAFSAVMIPRQGVVVVPDIESGGIATGSWGVQVEFGPDTVVDDQGASVSGPIEVFMTPVDVSKADVAAFPGIFAGFPEESLLGTQPQPIASLGTAEFHLMQNGKELGLAPGASAKVRLPLFTPLDVSGSPLQAGQSLPLWSLDESLGLWRQEGEGVVVSDADSTTGYALEGVVGHFSWWNADQLAALSGGNTPFQGSVIGRIRDASGGGSHPMPAGSFMLLSVAVGAASAPVSVASVSVPAGGSALELPSTVPLTLHGETSFPDGQGGLTLARGVQATILPAGQAGTVEVTMGELDVPIPLIVAPNDPAATNSVLQTYVHVEIDGARTPDDLAILLDGAPVASFGPQFFYTTFLDTAAAQEGTHELLARATTDGIVVDSPSVSLIVDRTPPLVVDIQPVPGVQVSNGQDVRITFSEPVTPFPFPLASAVTAVVAASDGSQAAVPFVAALDSSARVLTLHFSAPLPQGELQASWGGLDDPAGNDVAGTIAAQWPVDKIQLLGPALEHEVDINRSVQLRVNAAGEPVAAHVRHTSELQVSRFDGVAWLPYPGSIHTLALAPQRAIALTLDGQDRPVVFLCEVLPSGVPQWRAARFSSGAWTTLGAPISTNSVGHACALSTDPSGRLVRSFTDAGNLLAERYEESTDTWTSLGQLPIQSNAIANEQALTFDALGEPILAWNSGFLATNAESIFTAAFDGSAWTMLGTLDSTPAFSPSLGGPSLIFDGGNLFVAWAKDPSAKVWSWDGSTWSDLGLSSGNGFHSNGKPPGLAVVAGKPIIGLGAPPFLCGVWSFDGTVWHGPASLTMPNQSFVPAPQLAAANGFAYALLEDCCTQAQLFRIFP